MDIGIGMNIDIVLGSHRHLLLLFLRNRAWVTVMDILQWGATHSIINADRMLRDAANKKRSLLPCRLRDMPLVQRVTLRLYGECPPILQQALTPAELAAFERRRQEERCRVVWLPNHRLITLALKEIESKGR